MNWAHLLTVIFALAKLGGYIAWSWWIVFMPSIVAIGLGLLILLFVFITAVVMAR